MSKCFKCGRDLGPKEEYMKMETEKGKICYVCYNRYISEEREATIDKIKIDSYSFGNIVIDGKSYSSDVIILKDRVIPNWWRKEGHELCLGDLKDIDIEKTVTLVVGTGTSGMMKVLEEVRDYFNSKGVKVIEERTDEACKTYNSLCNSHDVSAVLHLTC